MPVIRYMVQNLESTLAFYTNYLGFSLQDRWGPAFAIVVRDGLELWLSGPQTSAARPTPDGQIPTSGGWNRIVIEVEDLQGLVESMKQAGVSFRNEIISGPGGKQILANDPSGNPIELFQPARVIP